MDLAVDKHLCLHSRVVPLEAFSNWTEWVGLGEPEVMVGSVPSEF